MREKVPNKINVNKFVILFGLFLFAVIIARLIYLNLSPSIDGINLNKFAQNRNTVKKKDGIGIRALDPFILSDSRGIGTVFCHNRSFLITRSVISTL